MLPLVAQSFGDTQPKSRHVADGGRPRPRFHHQQSRCQSDAYPPRTKTSRANAPSQRQDRDDQRRESRCPPAGWVRSLRWIAKGPGPRPRAPLRRGDGRSIHPRIGRVHFATDNSDAGCIRAGAILPLHRSGCWNRCQRHRCRHLPDRPRRGRCHRRDWLRLLDRGLPRRPMRQADVSHPRSCAYSV
jgi:hypothetical protein